MSTQKLVIVALSGGIDSAVSAWLLLQQNYKVLGIHMSNWNLENTNCSTQNWNDVQYSASKLCIPVVQTDFSKEYWIKVVMH